jgi:ABC-type multidrug transport system fused ATPase/permease subunit
MFKINQDNINLYQDFLNDLDKLNQDIRIDLNKIYSHILNNLKNIIKNILINQNPLDYFNHIKMIVLIILILYISSILLKYNSLVFPQYIINLFENPLIRFFIIIFILLISFIDLQLTIIITIAFLLTVHIINKQKVNKILKNNI